MPEKAARAVPSLSPLPLKSVFSFARQSLQGPSARRTVLLIWSSAERGSTATCAAPRSGSGTKVNRNALKLSSSASGATL